MARRIPSIPEQWNDFIICIVLHMVFPLLPLLIEFIIIDSITDKTLAITTSMYSVAIGLSSRSMLMFVLCFVISFIFSAIFGMISVSQSFSLAYVHIASTISIFCIFVIHCCERYNKHVVDCAPFWEFSQLEVR